MVVNTCIDTPHDRLVRAPKCVSAKSTGSPPASMVHTLPLSTHIIYPPFPHGHLPLQPLQPQFPENVTPQPSMFETNPETCFLQGLCPSLPSSFHPHLRPRPVSLPSRFHPHPPPHRSTPPMAPLHLPQHPVSHPSRITPISLHHQKSRPYQVLSDLAPPPF